MSSPSPADPISLAERRLAWVDRRQKVLAQNIANADTPGYRAQDITPFRQVLARSGLPELAVTNAAHLAAPGGAGPRAKDDRALTEVSPDGNGVSLDTQALKVAENDQAHALAIGLYKRFQAMFRTALGQQS